MEIVTLFIITLFTFLTRITNLLNIPIFTDEAIYIRWAQIGLADPAHRYLSLTDGKQPLLTWLMYPFLRIFSDPLFAGRFVSVLSGVFAVIGIYLLSRELFGKKAAIISSVIYIFSPFALLYDRLALMDSLLAAFGIWSIYMSILLVRKPKLDISLIFGITVGLGMLTKSSALFFLALLPISLLLFDFKTKNKIKRFISWVGLSALSTVIAEVMYNSLRLSPWFYIIKLKNYSFILTFAEFLHKPFETFWPNLYGLSTILIGYLTVPIILVVIAGVASALFRKKMEIIYLFLWFLIPFMALVIMGKVIFPRFILFMVMPLLVIVSSVIVDMYKTFKKNKKLVLILGIIIFIYPIFQSVLIIFSPVDVAIHRIDRNQLFDDWPSGYGVNEVVTYIKSKAENGKVVLGTEGTFGLNPAVYEIYLGLDKNVEIHGYWPVGEVPKELLDKAKIYPTYLVFKEKQDIPQNWPLKLIAKYRRGKGETFLLFYQVVPQEP